MKHLNKLRLVLELGNTMHKHSTKRKYFQQISCLHCEMNVLWNGSSSTKPIVRSWVLINVKAFQIKFFILFPLQINATTR